jgi:hypothetical protein
MIDARQLPGLRRTRTMDTRNRESGVGMIQSNQTDVTFAQTRCARLRHAVLGHHGNASRATVSGLCGVIATATTVEGCRKELAEVIEAWLLVCVARGLCVPALGRATIQVKRASFRPPWAPTKRRDLSRDCD